MAGMLGGWEVGMIERCYWLKVVLFFAADVRRQSSADLAEDKSQCPSGISMITFDSTRHDKYSLIDIFINHYLNIEHLVI